MKEEENIPYLMGTLAKPFKPGSEKPKRRTQCEMESEQGAPHTERRATIHIYTKKEEYGWLQSRF